MNVIDCFEILICYTSDPSTIDSFISYNKINICFINKVESILTKINSGHNN